jgi:hypothetical protein
MTVWEAHFGRKPNLNRNLIGPWSCLAYTVLTEEQRNKRGMNGQELGSKGFGRDLCRLHHES